MIGRDKLVAHLNRMRIECDHLTKTIDDCIALAALAPDDVFKSDDRTYCAFDLFAWGTSQGLIHSRHDRLLLDLMSCESY